MIKVMMSSTNSLKKNGVTNVILNLYRNIDRSKFQVDFICINEPEHQIREEIERLGGRINIIDRSMKHPIQFINNYKNLCRNYDIVHAHGNSATLALEMIAAWKAGVKVRIAHSHNSTCLYSTVDKLFRPLFYRFCNSYLACGNKAGKWLFRNRKYTIINNGIDTEKFRYDEHVRNAIRKAIGWKSNIIVGNVAGMIESKNHDFLIDVFEELYRKDNRYRLILLGEGELKTQIQNKINKLGLDDAVLLAGSVDNVHEYLSAIDLIIMPSLFEGFPLTLVEEQANGLNCIVSNNITKDVNLTGDICYLSLGESAKQWSNYIENFKLSERSVKKSENNIGIIRNKGFDSKKSAEELENYYFRRMRECANSESEK